MGFLLPILYMGPSSKTDLSPPREDVKHRGLILIHAFVHSSIPGADPGFFLGGGAPLRNAVTDVFCFAEYQFIRKPQVISGGMGGGFTPCTLPQDPPPAFARSFIQPRQSFTHPFVHSRDETYNVFIQISRSLSETQDIFQTKYGRSKKEAVF